jgi:hypothetical protein
MKTSWCLLKLSLLFFSLWACPRTAHAYYDPGVQRWINRDPVAENGGINVFRFAANSPSMRIDPDGRYCLFTAACTLQFGEDEEIALRSCPSGRGYYQVCAYHCYFVSAVGDTCPTSYESGDLVAAPVIETTTCCHLPDCLGWYLKFIWL